MESNNVLHKISQAQVAKKHLAITGLSMSLVAFFSFFSLIYVQKDDDINKEGSDHLFHWGAS